MDRQSIRFTFRPRPTYATFSKLVTSFLQTCSAALLGVEARRDARGTLRSICLRSAVTGFAFEDLTLVVPELWDKPWPEYIEDAEGLDREFLVAQARYAQLLQRIKPSPVTPEKIGWLSLWSRLFGSLTGGRGSAEWESRFAVSVLGRVAYEAALQVEAIMLPVLDASQDKNHRLGHADWSAVRDRLRGYLAWSLRGDERLYRHVSAQRHLDEAFDPRPERDFIRDLGERQEAWQLLSGQQLELVSDQEAFQDRRHAAEFFRRELNRVMKWLSDPRLQSWNRRLRDLERKGAGTVSLFQLLNAGNNVPSFLRSRGAGIGYYEYLKGSTFVHGSSLESSMLTTETQLAPDFANLGKGFETAAGRLLSHCRLHALLLDLMAGHLDEDDDSNHSEKL